MGDGTGQESSISNMLFVHLKLKLKSPLTQQGINSPGRSGKLALPGL